MPKKRTWRDFPKELNSRMETLKADGESITRELAVREAKDLLHCYNESGHALNEELLSEDISIRTDAYDQVRCLERYISNFQKF